MLRMCNNGSGGNDDDKCSVLGGGCSDCEGNVEYNGDGSNGIGDGSNCGKDDSIDSGGDGKYATVAKLRL
jgi:hypothetical protein